MKEVQLSPRIDPHDLGVKVGHAIDFLCEDMKVKVALRFRGREMAHTDVGFEVVKKFVAEVEAFGHPDFAPKLVGRGISLMISPLPRNKRGKNPRQTEANDEEVNSRDATNQAALRPTEKKRKTTSPDALPEDLANSPSPSASA